MAKPTAFPQTNFVYRPPSNWDEARGPCDNLPVYRDEVEIVSCWQLSWRELWYVLRTRRIWLRIAGSIQPPVIVDAVDPWTGT